MGNGAGKALPFNLVESPLRFRFQSAWSVQPAVGSEPPHVGNKALIWRADKRTPGTANLWPLISNGFKNQRMLRHPYVLKCIEAVESEEGNVLTLVTEPAVPLSSWVTEHRGDADYSAACLWGLYSLCTALAFLNNDCKLIHGNVSCDTVFVRPSGDWVLACFEYTTPIANADEAERAMAQRDNSSLCPSSHRSPERVNGDYALVCTPASVQALDGYSLALLLAEVFTGSVVTGTREHKAIADGSWDGLDAMPKELRALLPRLLSPAPRGRTGASHVLDCAWFKQPLVGALLFLDELALKEPKDKQRFFTTLPSLLSRFPASINRHRILPTLVRSLEYGAASGNGVNSTTVLGPILDIGATLSEAEYAKEISPCVVKLFASNDRAMRVSLLGALSSFMANMDEGLLNNSIFPSIVNGFTDTNPVLREATVKAAVQFAPKLTPTAFHQILLKHLKRCLTDTEPGIRVNTTICLGKIAEYADAGARTEELLACFLRSMRDPVSHARAAAMRAVAHCMSLGSSSSSSSGRPAAGRPALYPFWDADTVAKRIMAAACHLAMDPVSEVRSASHVVLDLGQRQLKEEHEKMAKVEAQQAAAAAAAVQQQGAGAAPEQAGHAGSSVSGGGSALGGALGWAASFAGLSAPVSGSINDPASSSAGSAPSTPVPAGQATAAAPSQQQRQQPASTAASRQHSSTAAAGAHSDRQAQQQSTAVASSSSSSQNVGSGWGDDDLDLDEPPVSKTRPSGGTAKTHSLKARGGGLGVPPSSGSPARDDTAADGWGANDDFEDSAPAPQDSASKPRSRASGAAVTASGDRTAARSQSPGVGPGGKAGSASASSGGVAGASGAVGGMKGKSMSLKGAAKPLEKGAGADGWDDW